MIADPVVRNRGTIGGALCQADPSEDLVAVCAAVGAPDGDPRAGRRACGRDARVLPGPVPHGGRAPPRCSSRSASRCGEQSGSAYEKVDRRVGDWAVAAAGASIALAQGTIAAAGIALAAVGAREVTSTEAEEALVGQPPSDELFARAARAAQEACEPVTDQRGSAEYKRHVVGVLTERTLRRAAERARAEQG